MMATMMIIPTTPMTMYSRLLFEPDDCDPVELPVLLRVPVRDAKPLDELKETEERVTCF